jgi:hypothetical protein
VLALKGHLHGRDADRSRQPAWCSESITFPDPVILGGGRAQDGVPIREDGRGAASKLSEEDPTFHVHSDEATGQTIIAGMGELHLEVLVDRMLREFPGAGQRGPPARSLTKSRSRARCRRWT